jgi:cytochrome bd-type quinol oxidase subunit 2
MMEFLMPLLMILGFALWIWALMDISKRRFRHSAQKWVWLALILIIPFIGPIIFFQVKRGVSRMNKRTYGANYSGARFRTGFQP